MGLFKDLLSPLPPHSDSHLSRPSEVTNFPSQDTVDRSGDDIQGEGAHYVGGQNTGRASVIGLPHPHPRQIQPGIQPLDDPDLLDLFKTFCDYMQRLDDHFRRLSLADDEAIKRRMRGPLKGKGTFGTDGIATITLGPVPSGEIWLVDRYIVNSDNGAATATLNCTVYDGGTVPDSLIDFTTLGNCRISDNTQPVILFPHSSLTFQWTGGTSGKNVWARANYRSIAVNLQFVNKDTNQ